MKLVVTISILLFCTAILFAQEHVTTPFQAKYHMLSPDELKIENNNSKDFIVTAPPTGNVRNIAEFEPNQGVIISYPSYYATPFTLIAELSQDVIIYIICETTSQSDEITLDFQTQGVNMDNVQFVYAPLDTQWTRDYSPWFIEYGDNRQVGIVDFPYNRPRPNDDEISNVLGNYFAMEVFGMNLIHTGGNYMTDGLGFAASCDLTYTENPSLTQQQIATMVDDFLGITDYQLVNDPLDDYIEHIDCWAKFLDVDKILMARVPTDDYRYADYETLADFWANKTSSYGNKYKVYRVDWVVDGNAYTNSLIMNNKVFVPFNTGAAGVYNAAAATAYQEAMPGYEVIGITYNDWYSTDALHCRTHEVPDFNMLRVLHYPYYDTVAYQTQFDFNADVYSFENSSNISSVKLFYKINDGVFNQVPMNLISGNQ
jgi:agmatine/peptidylarginine deiminase